MNIRLEPAKDSATKDDGTAEKAPRPRHEIVARRAVHVAIAVDSAVIVLALCAAAGWGLEMPRYTWGFLLGTGVVMTTAAILGRGVEWALRQIAYPAIRHQNRRLTELANDITALRADVRTIGHIVADLRTANPMTLAAASLAQQIDDRLDDIEGRLVASHQQAWWKGYTQCGRDLQDDSLGGSVINLPPRSVTRPRGDLTASGERPSQRSDRTQGPAGS